MKLIIFLIFITLSFADYHKDKEYHKVHHIYKDLSHINLNDIQYNKAKEILKEYKLKLKEYKNLKEDIEDKKEKLFKKENFDIKEYVKLNDKLNALKNDINSYIFISFHKILTKEQKEDFAEHLEDWEIE